MARTGPYAAAQLWKLDSVHGRYFDLAGHIAPFLGDPTELVPEEWLELFRSIGRFALPRLIPGLSHLFKLFAEEVRGTGRMVWVCTHNSPVATLRTIPRNGTRRGYYYIHIEFDEAEAFLTEWFNRYDEYWPFVVDMGVAVVHPAFEGIYARALDANNQWRDHGDRRSHDRWLRGRARDELGRPLED
jgi:hypothetical protein